MEFQNQRRRPNTGRLRGRREGPRESVRLVSPVTPEYHTGRPETIKQTRYDASTVTRPTSQNYIFDYVKLYITVTN